MFGYQFQIITTCSLFLLSLLTGEADAQETAICVSNSGGGGKIVEYAGDWVAGEFE